MLVDEPVRAFDLHFGVLMRRAGAGALEPAYASGMPSPPARVTDAQSLCAYLMAERKALALRKHFWDATQLRCAGVEPSIAVPVFSHDDLTAIAFFAPHRSGTEFDSDELALIDRLADAAGAAYDRLEANALREQLGRLQFEVQT
jgi:GAF domain-containing protein